MKKDQQQSQEQSQASTSEKDIPPVEVDFPEKTEDITGKTDVKSPGKKPQKIPTKRRSAPGKKPPVDKKPPAPEPVYTPYQFVDKATCKMIASLIPFSILAVLFQNDAYELNEKEKEQLAPLWDKIADKYIPEMISEFSEEASLGVTISLILVEKSGVIQSLIAPEKDEKE